jgi:methyl-accepting chemotaxis protein
MSEIDESMKSLSTESGLVKLNASIDAVQDQSNKDNYLKLIDEIEILVKKISDIASSSGVSSKLVGNKVADLSKKVKGARENVRRGLDDTVKVGSLLDTVNEHSLEAASVYGTVFEKIKNLNTLMDEANVKRMEFSKTIKVSIDHFDKLKSDTQITLIKFNQLEEKIEGIKENLKTLETFKNSFQIA